MLAELGVAVCINGGGKIELMDLKHPFVVCPIVVGTVPVGPVTILDAVAWNTRKGGATVKTVSLILVAGILPTVPDDVVAVTTVTVAVIAVAGPIIVAVPDSVSVVVPVVVGVVAVAVVVVNIIVPGVVG